MVNFIGVLILYFYNLDQLIDYSSNGNPSSSWIWWWYTYI